ncbi:MAG: 2-amino-4-hydroxy-6-hydroxymethyldihydropteridine diphosphokinase [Planctomycetes bacterium]|nr:2-amino-4-hydroxy-6-hydroxymethyldihydropteridine diphosphokinase [Planctomycetota bacterium]MCB9909543.1 2-amino-4-hydroxy-6-hydroxymethyldihydropteridine diphosphokinase [Planctomycetota bacterium]MCB9912490.1 2-amino-4-hydroxy-6-hydroxymethyldihydropteridine diphosphokinase [Planctomycetota bacterium]HPF14425.1 2-amino-4-hydroxy-6-hydroxymethyldihydropteridine diphosphokinase [Planctomycetota bacterium]HRV80496.1 2-amino-4-hydroxy-6-hydroxymethyldihydropteridine diphosphokinase [Planctomy
MQAKPSQPRVRAAIAFGGNLGDVERTFKRAMTRLERTPGITILRRSDWIHTEPEGTPPGSPVFLNGAITVETTLSPGELLAVCLETERHFGRDRSQEPRFGPRSLDLDLLLYAEQVVDEPDLCVPHPRMHLRRFVLEPLAQIAGDWPVPGQGTSVAGCLEALERASDGAPRS